MNHSIIAPCIFLKDYVSHFWASCLDVKTGALYYSTANTNTELALAFRNTGTGRQLLFASVQGHTQQYAQLPLDAPALMFGVSMYSHAVPALFGVSPAALTGQLVDIDALLGMYGNDLSHSIINAATLQDRVKILSDYFISRIIRNDFADKMALQAVKTIRQQQGMAGISSLASDLCLSQKQFERRFRNYTGFNPKTYARIIRFENALASHKKYKTLGEMAHAYGYYDQAHFISDFKAFTGYTPRTFFSLSGY